MHMDEDRTNLPISFALPELLVCIGSAHTNKHMYKHTHHQTEGSNKNSLIFLFENADSYLCYSCIVLLLQKRFRMEKNECRSAFTDVHMSKWLFKKTATVVTHNRALKDKTSLVSFTFSKRSTKRGDLDAKDAALISSDLNARITASQITVWLWYLPCIMISYDK